MFSWLGAVCGRTDIPCRTCGCRKQSKYMLVFNRSDENKNFNLAKLIGSFFLSPVCLLRCFLSQFLWRLIHFVLSAWSLGSTIQKILFVKCLIHWFKIICPRIFKHGRKLCNKLPGYKIEISKYLPRHPRCVEMFVCRTCHILLYVRYFWKTQLVIVLLLCMTITITSYHLVCLCAGL